MKSTLLLALATLGTLAPAEVVHGTLVDRDGKPLAGLTLMGYAIEEGVKGRSGITNLLAKTDVVGAFTLDNAPARPTAHAPVVLMTRLPNGHLATVSLAEEGGKATAKDEVATLRVSAKDPKGAPIAGATATLENVAAQGAMDAPVRYFGTWREKTGLSATTDAGGTATFEGLPVGANLMFTVTKPGLLKRDGFVPLAANGSSEFVTLARAATVAGRVLREGKPVPGVNVSATSVVGNMGTRAFGKTDANGEYRLADV